MTAESVLAQAVARGDVPFVVAQAGNAAGTTFSCAAGEAAPGRAADESTVFRIFSMTKAIGSLAAMILIDRGRFSLDAPVADILPQWNDLQVLDGWDGDTPRMRAPKGTATIRHLATHRSGIEYEHWNADVTRFLKVTSTHSVRSGRKEAFATHPLTFDPGTRWGYGPSIDWLGQVVEAVDGRRIDAFCADEIFEPLGMRDTAFEPDDFEDRLSQVNRRTPEGGFEPAQVAPPAKPDFYGMGHALYSTAPDYMRFLRMVLNRGELDGNRVLSEGAMAEMCADQMEGKTFQPMISASPGLTADVHMPEGTTHSAAFVRFNSDQPGMRRAGSLGWAGICNTHYWIDPASDLCAVIMTQSRPFVEPRFLATYRDYERALYAGLG